MTKLKFVKNNQKKNKVKKIYFLKIASTKKTTKFNHLINLGSYIANKKLYTFKYPLIISYSKLGSNLSKQVSLISLFYLKNILNKNI